MKIKIILFSLASLIILSTGYYFYTPSNKKNIHTKFDQAGISFQYNSKMNCEYKHDEGDDHWYINDHDDVMIKVFHINEKNKEVSLWVLRMLAITIECGDFANPRTIPVKEDEIGFTCGEKIIKGYEVQFDNGKVQEIYGCETLEGTTMIVLQDKRDSTKNKPTDKFLAMKKLFTTTLKLKKGSQPIG